MSCHEQYQSEAVCITYTPSVIHFPTLRMASYYRKTYAPALKVKSCQLCVLQQRDWTTHHLPPYVRIATQPLGNTTRWASRGTPPVACKMAANCTRSLFELFIVDLPKLRSSCIHSNTLISNREMFHLPFTLYSSNRSYSSTPRSRVCQILMLL